eukprot:Sspe_Gene.74157::Locus_45643_Transcript_1_1_Confidence_1.000_Length_1689::g.74157::m.74157
MDGVGKSEWKAVCDLLRSTAPVNRTEEDVLRLVSFLGCIKGLQSLPLETKVAVSKVLYYEREQRKGAEMISMHELHHYTGPWRIILWGSVETRIARGTGRATHDLIKGDTFGDDLVLSALPQGSSIVTKEPCEFVCLQHADYERLLQHLEDRELDARVQYFQALLVPVFASWSSYQLRELAKRTYPLRFGSRQVIVREREEGTDLYFIVKGECRVVREIEFNEAASGKVKKTVKLLELAVLQPGEYFGELAI